jgi:hypothetical protein
LIIDLEVEHSGVKQSMLKALGNVMPRNCSIRASNPAASCATARRCARRRRRETDYRSSIDGFTNLRIYAFAMKLAIRQFVHS